LLTFRGIFLGKAAVSDLLREFSGYHVPPAEQEFELIRIQGGIRDLETALVTDWSPIRANFAINKFKQVVTRLGVKNNKWDIRTWFEGAGWSYEKTYGCDFLKKSFDFINDFIVAEWRTDWPYPRADLSSVELLYHKILKFIGMSGAYKFNVSLAKSDEDKFLLRVDKYLRSILCYGRGSKDKAIVIHNGFEPFNPERGMRYIKDSKCILIDRDPRDSYVAQAPHSHLSLDVNSYIDRYKCYRLQNFQTNDSRVLRLRYEDLIYEYENTVKKILDFLEEGIDIHRFPKKFFDPGKSVKYTNLWQEYPFQEEIKKIDRELGEFCDKRLS
jgi:hypothetical protein